MTSAGEATVRFNVGGKHFEVSRSLITEQTKPDTMLARLVSDTWTWQASSKDSSKPLFNDRDGDHFRHVLNYSRYGRVTLSHTISKHGFLQDMDSFGIPAGEGTVD